MLNEDQLKNYRSKPQQLSNATFHLPAAVSAGAYELLLNLPDGYQSLQGNPAYSIRLANEDLWEVATGFNKLKHVLQVRSTTVK